MGYTWPLSCVQHAPAVADIKTYPNCKAMLISAEHGTTHWPKEESKEAPGTLL